jgi:hypothetical protein
LSVAQVAWRTSVETGGLRLHVGAARLAKGGCRQPAKSAAAHRTPERHVHAPSEALQNLMKRATTAARNLLKYTFMFQV